MQQKRVTLVYCKKDSINYCANLYHKEDGFDCCPKKKVMYAVQWVQMQEYWVEDNQNYERGEKEGAVVFGAEEHFWMVVCIGA